jgi:hypothetical protein
MLTYLDSPSPQHFGERADGFPAIAIVGTCTLAVQVLACLAPGQIVYHAQAVAPENGRAMGHGQKT